VLSETPPDEGLCEIRDCMRVRNSAPVVGMLQCYQR
jgi:hypothetical protein